MSEPKIEPIKSFDALSNPEIKEGEYEGIKAKEIYEKREEILALKNFLFDKKNQKKLKSLISSGEVGDYKTALQILEDSKAPLELLLRLAENEEIEDREDEKIKALKIWEECKPLGKIDAQIQLVKNWKHKVEALVKTTPLSKPSKEAGPKKELETVLQKFEKYRNDISAKLSKETEVGDRKFLEDSFKKVIQILDYINDPGKAIKEGRRLTEDERKFWATEVRPEDSRLNTLLKTKTTSASALSAPTPKPTPPIEEKGEKEDPNETISFLNGNWDKLNPETKKNRVYEASREVIKFFYGLHDEKYKLKEEELKSIQRTINILDDMTQKKPISPEDNKFWDEIESVSVPNTVRDLIHRKLTEKDKLMTTEESILKRLEDTETTPDIVNEAKLRLQTEINSGKYNERQKSYLRRVENSFHNILNALENNTGDILKQHDLENWEQYSKGQGANRLIEEKNNESHGVLDLEITGKDVKDLIEEIGVRNVIKIQKKLHELKRTESIYYLSPVIQDTTSLLAAFDRLSTCIDKKTEDLSKRDFSQKSYSIIKGFLDFYGGTEAVLNALNDEETNNESGEKRIEQLVAKYGKENIRATYERLKLLPKEIINSKKSAINALIALSRFFDLSKEYREGFNGNDVNTISFFIDNPNILSDLEKKLPKRKEEVISNVQNELEKVNEYLLTAEKEETKEYLNGAKVVLERMIETYNKTSPSFPYDENNKSDIERYAKEIGNGHLEQKVAELERLAEETGENTETKSSRKISTTEIIKPEPIVPDREKISPEDRALIDEKLKVLGIEVKDFRNMPGFNLIKNDAGRQLFVIQNFQQLWLQYAQEETMRRHNNHISEKGLGRLARLRLNLMPNKNIQNHRDMVLAEGFKIKNFADEANNLANIAHDGPDMTIERTKNKNGVESYQLIGQYVDQQMMEQFGIDKKLANSFNRAASRFAEQPTELDANNLERKDKHLKKSRETAKEQYEAEKTALLYHLADKKGLETRKYNRESGEVTINPELQAMIETNLIDFKVYSHQMNIQHPEIENALRNFQEGKGFGTIGVGAFALGAATRLGISFGRGVSKHYAVAAAGAPWILGISAAIGGVFGAGRGAYKGWTGAKKEIAKRDLDIRQGKQNVTHNRSISGQRTAYTLDKNFVQAKDLQQKMEHVKNQLQIAIDNKDPLQIAKWTEVLKVRIDYTNRKLGDESVIFGNSRQSLKNRFDLIQMMSGAAAAATIGEIKREGIEAMGRGEGKASEEKRLSRIDRLNILLRTNTMGIEKVRTSHAWSKTRQGAVKGGIYGAAFAVLGGATTDLLLHHTSGGQYVEEQLQKAGAGLGEFIKHTRDYAAFHGQPAAESLANHTAEKLQASAAFVATNNHLAAIAEHTSPTTAHEELSQNVAQNIKESIPTSSQVTDNGFTLENEGQSREYAIARILQKDHPGMSLHEAQVKANIIVKNPNWDLGNESKGIHHSAHDREWRDYKVMHQGDRVILDEDNRTVRIIKAKDVSEYMQSHGSDTVESNVESPKDAVNNSGPQNTPSASVAEASPTAVTETPQEILKFKETELADRLKQNLDYYDYSGSKDPIVADRWSHSISKLFLSNDKYRLLAADPGNMPYPTRTPDGGWDVVFRHQQFEGQPWDKAPEVANSHILFPGDSSIPQNEIRSSLNLNTGVDTSRPRLNIYGKLIDPHSPQMDRGIDLSDHSSSPSHVDNIEAATKSPTIETPHFTPPSPDAIRDMSEAFQLSPSTVKGLAEITVRSDMSNLEQITRLLSPDRHVVSLGQDQRNRFFLRVAEHFAGLSKETLKSAGINNFWDTPSGTTFNSAALFDKGAFNDIFNNLDHPNPQESAMADAFAKRSGAILENLKTLSHNRPVTSEDFENIVKVGMRNADGDML